MDFDFSQFQKALDEYLRVTPHRLEEALNKKAAFIILEARKQTPLADRAAIEALFQILVQERVSKKSGKIRRKYFTAKPHSQLVGLLIARLRRAGKPIPTNAELQRLAESLPGRSVRAIGSLRSGWRNSLVRMLKAANMTGDTRGPRVSHQGRAKPAVANWDPVAEWEFNLATSPPGSPGQLQIDPRVEDALRAGFVHETASMEQYLHDQLQPDADKINAR